MARTQARSAAVKNVRVGSGSAGWSAMPATHGIPDIVLAKAEGAAIAALANKIE
ncbi:hypothetical protein GCM10023069_12500 [Shinella granuli]